MKGDCGIAINNPDENDKSTWKCYLGVRELGSLDTVGAILEASSEPQKFEGTYILTRI